MKLACRTAIAAAKSSTLCTCDAGKCCTCGCKLAKEEIEAGRDQCFDCFCIDQD